MKAPDSVNPIPKRSLCPWVLLACTLFLWGWGDSLEEIREKVDAVSSVSAAFTQERHLEILEEPLISKGRLYFEAPGSLRWEYTGPVRSILLMKGDSIRQYAQSGDDMVEQQGRGPEAMGFFLRDACLWMQGEFDANPDLAAHMESGGRIILKPEENNAMAQVIRKIELWLTDTPGIIDSVRIYEDPDNYTNIRFHETRINQNIEAGIFQKPDP